MIHVSGCYAPFPTVEAFAQYVTRVNLDLPEDEPIINLRRIGSKRIEIAMQHKWDDQQTQKKFKVVKYECQVMVDKWFDVGSTENKSFHISEYLDGGRRVQLLPETEYRVQVRATIRNMENKTERMSSFSFSAPC